MFTGGGGGGGGGAGGAGTAAHPLLLKTQRGCSAETGSKQKCFALHPLTLGVAYSRSLTDEGVALVYLRGASGCVHIVLQLKPCFLSEWMLPSCLYAVFTLRPCTLLICQSVLQDGQRYSADKPHRLLHQLNKKRTL